MTKPLPPAEAVAGNLVQVDRTLKTLNTDQPVAVAQASIGVAQVYATCALVHAVRDLTAAVRALKEDA